MQGRSQDQRDLLDVESVAGHLLPSGCVFAFLAEHLAIDWSPLRCSRSVPHGSGPPSVPPEVMAWVIVLQTLHGLSDRKTAEVKKDGRRRE